MLGLVCTLKKKKNDAEVEQEGNERHSPCGFPCVRETAHMVSLVWTSECALESFKRQEEVCSCSLCFPIGHSVYLSAAPSRSLVQRARRVGELRESEDWSPLLLLRRWALEQDSEEGEGLSGSSMLG